MAKLKHMVEELEKEMILTALRESGGVKARAARSLDISERILGYKMKKYGIQKVYRAESDGTPKPISADMPEPGGDSSETHKTGSYPTKM